MLELQFRRPVKNLIGCRFNKWVVISLTIVKGKTMWTCKCDCGTVGIVSASKLKSGRSKSCRYCVDYKSIKTIHGHTSRIKGSSRTYISWDCMIQRCNNPNNIAYNDYGGRGITVCKEWLDFKNFLKDMGERPIGKTLDRINNSGNYSIDNCRWATKSEQELNKRRF